MLDLPIELWIAIIAFTSAGLLLWLLLTEGSYLSRGWVRRSYDWLAPWYENKWKSEEYQSTELNRKLFIEPILAATGGEPQSRVLDLACGTGRVSCLLLDDSSFHGQIEAVDFSNGMLHRFQEHLSHRSESQQGRVQLRQLDLADWKCGQPESYDAVLFLEAAELIPQLPDLLSEVRKSLKPSGVLLTTRVGPRFKWLFPGRHQHGESMNRLLADNGFKVFATSSWRKRYDVIVASPQQTKIRG